MQELADPEFVISLTNEIISMEYIPVLIDQFGFFFKEVPGKPGKTIYVGISLFGFDKDNKAFHLENKNGKCVLLEIYQHSIKDKQAGVSFTIKKEDLVTRECVYYKNKKETHLAINEAANRINKKLEQLRS